MTKTNDFAKRKAKDYVVKSIEDGFIIKDVDLAKKIVTGIYNTFQYLDSDYDVLLPGCSSKSIGDRGPASSSVVKIKHLLFHDWTKLPGKIEVLQEKTVTINSKKVQGIYFETKMSDSTDGTDTLIKYQEGIYDNHSIGFQYMDGQWIDSEADNWQQAVDKLINPQKALDAGFMYLWKEIKLFEGSTVAFGANELTPTLGIKDAKNKDLVLLKMNDRLNLLNKQLHTGTVSDESMEAFEMQILQIKQLLSEIFSERPSIKSTLPKEPGEKSDTSQMITCPSCGDFDAQNMEPNDDGAYACPNCNVLCMPGTKNSLFSNLQFI